MTSLRKFLLSSLFLSLAAPHLHAQLAPQRDPQAAALLARSFAAMGGREVYSVKDIVVEGTLALPDAPAIVMGSFVAKIRGRDMRIQLTIAGETSTYTVLKGVGTVRTKGQSARLQQFNTMDLSLDLLPLFSRWAEFTNPKSEIHAASDLVLDGKPLRAIRVNTPKEFPEFGGVKHNEAEVFVDPDSGLVYGIRYTLHGGPYVTDQIAVENYYSQYRSYSGFLLPSTIVRHLWRKPIRVFHLTAVSFNTGLNDNDFSN